MLRAGSATLHWHGSRRRQGQLTADVRVRYNSQKIVFGSGLSWVEGRRRERIGARPVKHPVGGALGRCSPGQWPRRIAAQSSARISTALASTKRALSQQKESPHPRNMTALRRNVSEGRKCEQSGAANPYPRHAPCWFRYAPLARITPQAGAADRGRSPEIYASSDSPF